ncbi:MAG: HAMP domain-containing histidine kinase [Oscillospiraceae bacterium]|nr:HAMP domain-containing histidine kinase [Oscillospiraceae bacterium]
MRNSLVVVVGVVLVVVLAFFVIVADYYYGNVETNLRTRASVAARSLTGVNILGDEAFSAAIIQYVEYFADRGSIEAQFIGQNGRIVRTSTGLTADFSPATPDVAQAMGGGGMSSSRGMDDVTGERVVSVTTPLHDGNGRLVGALRLVTSLRRADARIAQSMMEALVVGLLAVMLIIVVNFVFINSVTKSLREINDTACQIAAGGYGIRIEKKYNDEIGQLAETLNHMSAEIRTAETIKSDFVSNVSHELRTPLTAISGWGETLLAGDVTDEEDVRQGIRIMLKETGRLSRMVEQLLDFTKQESDRFVMTMEPFDLGTELGELLSFYRDVYNAEGIAVHYDALSKENTSIVGDKERIKQVMINLLDNSAKHGLADLDVTDENKRIDVSLQSVDDKLVIAVRDHGKGVAPEDISHVKLKYYRGTSGARGSGIGLTIADEIVRAHNGSLDIESAPDGGTMVTVTLPQLTTT